MKEDLKTTRWSRVAVRLSIPSSTGVFLLGTNGGDGPDDVLFVGSASNLREKLLDLLGREELKTLGATVIHWVADLTIEQARIAERLFIRRYNPPLNLRPATRYLDILAG